MAKTRMANWMRDKLREHAKKAVQPAKEHAALTAAYRKAMPLVRALVHQRYPVKDMKVLERYGSAAHPLKCKVQYPDGSVEEFIFSDGEAPAVAVYHTHEIYLADADAAASVEAWRDAAIAYEKERKARLAAYDALIAGSVNVEDLVEAWPEAAGVIPKAHLPLAFGPEQIAIVRRDLQERKAA